jgi:ribose transport system substrate-binding protein
MSRARHASLVAIGAVALITASACSSAKTSAGGSAAAPSGASGGSASTGASAPAGSSGASASTNGDSAKKLNISLLTTYNGLPFYTAMQCGALDAAKKLGNVSLSVDGPSHGMNVADQTPVLNTVVSRHPDGLIFVPADPVAMLAPVKQAQAAGIKLVTADATLSQPIASAQFHADNSEGGKLAAQEMLKVASGKSGEVLVMDNRPGLPVTNQRAQGFIDAVKSTTSLHLLPTAYFQDDPTKAATIVQSTLAAHPDIVGIFATSEAGAMGAVSGLKAAGSAPGKVAVIAYDAGPELVTALKNGALDALIAQGSYTQGYDAMTRVVEELRHDVPADAEFDNVVPNALVTKQNVDNPDIKKLLYPKSCS